MQQASEMPRTRRRQCWPTCSHSARDASSPGWHGGRCAHNKCYDDGAPFVPGILVKCNGCCRSACTDCLAELQKGAKQICDEFGKKGLELQHTAELDALVSGQLIADMNTESGATVGKVIDRCIWCKDTRIPVPVPRMEPRVLRNEMGVDDQNTYATSAPRLSEESLRCGLHRAPPCCSPVPNPHCHILAPQCHTLRP